MTTLQRKTNLQMTAETKKSLCNALLLLQGAHEMLMRIPEQFRQETAETVLALQRNLLTQLPQATQTWVTGEMAKDKMSYLPFMMEIHTLCHHKGSDQVYMTMIEVMTTLLDKKNLCKRMPEEKYKLIFELLRDEAMADMTHGTPMFSEKEGQLYINFAQPKPGANGKQVQPSDGDAEKSS